MSKFCRLLADRLMPARFSIRSVLTRDFAYLYHTWSMEIMTRRQS
jgi:hypothetical protein